MNKKAKLLLSVFGSLIIILPVYILLHESGHSLVAVFCGAHITEFSILSAYMSYEGGEFHAFSTSLLNAAGMLLPVMISLVYIVFYNQKKQNVFYRIFSFMFSLVSFSSLIAWVIFPMLYLFGKAPSNDDVTKFIDNSGMSPWLVSLLALLLFLGGVALAWKKRILQNYWRTCRNMKEDQQATEMK